MLLLDLVLLLPINETAKSSPTNTENPLNTNRYFDLHYVYTEAYVVVWLLVTRHMQVFRNHIRQKGRGYL